MNSSQGFLLKLKTYNLKPVLGFIPLEIRPAYYARRQPPRGGLSLTGFTLIEILVILVITMIITVFALTYGTTSREQIALSIEEAKIVQVILRAKSLAVGTFNQPTVPCGYGVHFDYANGTYAITSYKPNDCSGIGIIDPAFVTMVDSFTLPSSVVFGDGERQITDLLFIPPDPSTVLNSGGAVLSGVPGSVYLETRGGSLSVEITVSQAGQVTF